MSGSHLHMYSQKGNCYFQNRIIMICLPVPTFIYLREIFISPGSVCLFCWREICGPILGIYKIAHWHMNVEIGTEAALFPEREYINGTFLAVYLARKLVNLATNICGLDIQVNRRRLTCSWGWPQRLCSSPQPSSHSSTPWLRGDSGALKKKI